MSRGLFVYELDKKEYLLTKRESDEVEAFSQSEPDDAKYNAWFLEYVKKNGIQPKADYTRSQYWSRVSSNTSDVARMATIQRAVTTLIRVASPEVKPSNVKFNDGTASTIDMARPEDMEITLPVKPTEGKTIYEAIDAIAGYGLHEAYHLKDTSRVLSGEIRQAIQQQNLDGTLYNFADDLRVNSLGNQDNPGFAHYIEEVYDQLYKDHANGYQLPDEWPTAEQYPDPKELSAQRMAALFGPIQYEKHIGDGSDKPYGDKIKAARNIMDRYAATGRKATSQTLMNTVRELKNILDVVVPKSERIPEGPCPISMDNAAGKGGGTSEAEEIAAAAAAGMEGGDLKENEFATGAGFGDSTITIVRPSHSRHPLQHIGKIPNEVLKADAHLRLTKTLSRNEDRYMRSGDLDEDELYRLYQGDDRVFIDATEEVEEEAVIYMCVDSSSSMRSSAVAGGSFYDAMMSRTTVASQMAWLLTHSMSKKKHVRTKVFAHTSGTRVAGVNADIHPGGTIIYRVFEKGESFDRLDWLVNMDQGGTPDQVALAVIGKEIVQEQAPSKYIIMINDGSPGAEMYDGMQEVRAVVNSLTRKGVHVIQIGISSHLSPEEQAIMYDHFVSYNNITQTIKDLAKILDKVR